MKSSTKSDKTKMPKLLRALASLIEKADDEVLLALAEGRAVLSKTSSKRGDDRSEVALHSNDENRPNLSEIVNRLKSLTSRDEGLSVMNSSSLTRKELEIVARQLEIPIMKTDNNERLIDKIVEQSIGARLNSLAIRGERMTVD